MLLARMSFARMLPARVSLGILVLLIITAAIAQSAPPTQPTDDSVPATQPEPTNLIVNGDFETPLVPDRCLAVSGDQLPGWKIERGDVDVTASTLWQSAHGDQSLDLNGFSRGIISQEVHTEPGQWYRLTFSYSANPHPDDTGRVAEVQWGDKLLTTLKPELATTDDMKWKKQEFVVQAKEKATTLVFISLTPGAYGVALDDIALVKCDPPPPDKK